MQCNIHSFYDSTVVELDNKAFHIMTNKNGYAYVYRDAEPKINAETTDRCIYKLLEQEIELQLIYKDGVVTAFRFKDTQFNIIRYSGSSYIVIIIRDGTIYDSRITKPTLYECIEAIIRGHIHD